MSVQSFRLPDVGEGLTEAEIVTWKVKPGDTVKVNDIVVEIETAKSLVELPSPYAGVVAELLVPEGQTVDVGTPIISVQTDSGAAAGSPGGAGRRAARRGAGCDRGRDGAGRGCRRARPDRWPGSGRPHVGAGGLRPAGDRGQAPAAQRRCGPGGFGSRARP